MFGDYELWSWNYPTVRVRRRSSVTPIRGIGEDPVAPTPTPPAPIDQRKMRDIGRGLFVGTAYGIALGMVLSEFVMRQRDAGAQLKQNHRLILLGSLFGAAVGGLGAVQAQAVQA